MPEIFVVLAILAVAVAAYLGALLTTRDPAQQNPVEDLATLCHQRGWLQQRLELARREKWDDAMIANLTEELNATEARIAAKRALVRA